MDGVESCLDKKSQKELHQNLAYIEKEFGGTPAEKYHSKVDSLIKSVLIALVPPLGFLPAACVPSFRGS